MPSGRCAARGRVPFPPTSSGAWSAGSTIRIARTVRRPTPAPRPKARVMSKAGSAGRRRRSARFATTTMRVRAAMSRNASAVIPGAAPGKITFCPRRIPSRSRSIRRRSAQGERLLRLVVAAAQWRQGREQDAAVQGQAHHRARAIRARQSRVRRQRVGEIAGRAHTHRSLCRGRGYFAGRARRFFRIGRKQSRPPGDLQRRARDGLRPDHAARGAAGLAQTESKTQFRAGCGGREARSEDIAEAKDVRRGSRRIAAAGVARVSLRLRAARRAMGQPRLSSLAIWLSVPHRHPARIGEPASRGDVRDARLFGRGGGRRAVPRHAVARGREKPRQRESARSARCVERSDLPQWRRRPHGQRELYAAGVPARIDANPEPGRHQAMVCAGRAQAPGRSGAVVDLAATMSASARSPLMR